MSNQTKNQSSQSKRQRQLIKIWQGLLKVEKIGLNDHFFNLGGHSTLVIEMSALIKERLSTALSLAEIFENPTIAKLDRLISLKAKNKKYHTLNQRLVKKLKSQPASVLSHAQQNIWQAMKIVSSEITYTPDFRYLKGRLNLKALNQAFQLIVNRHEILRTAIFEIKGKDNKTVLVKKILRPKKVRLRYVDLRRQSGAGAKKTEAKIIKSEKNKISLKRGEPIKIIIVRYSLNEYALVILYHLIILDALTAIIFRLELGAAYASVVFKKPLKLSYPLTQYREYVSWQENAQHENDLEGQEKYWTEKLKAGSSILNLPTDKKNHDADNLATGLKKIIIERELEKRAADFCRRQKLQPFIFFFSLFNLFLHGITKQSDIIVDSSISKREKKEFRNLIGPAYNRLPTRSIYQKDDSFIQFMLKNKKTILSAAKNSDFYDFYLIKNIAQNRLNQASPLFNTCFEFVFLPPVKSFGNLAITKKTHLDDRALFQEDSFYDLVFCVYQYVGEFQFYFVYKKNRFSDSAMNKLSKTFSRLLADVLKNPKKKMSSIYAS